MSGRDRLGNQFENLEVIVVGAGVGATEQGKMAPNF
jgi:hypothetical protein